MTRLVAAALLLAWFAPSQAAGPPLRTDLFGDPLPPGAIARFGSMRLRHAGLWDFVCLPDGKTAVTAGKDRAVRYWNLDTGRLVRERRIQAEVGIRIWVTLSPDGRLLAAREDRDLVVWEVASGKELKRTRRENWSAHYLRFSPDGRTLAVVREDYKVILWDWQAGTSRELPLLPAPRPVVRYHQDGGTQATFSPDGKWIAAAANSDEPLAVFDVATGRAVHRLPWGAYASSFSPDGKTLAVCSTKNDKGDRETVFRFVDLASGKEVRQFPQGNEEPCHALAFSPDGRRLACGRADTSRVLDVATGRVLHRLSDRPFKVAYSPDGTRLLGSVGSVLRVWDAGSGKERLDHVGDFAPPLTTAISPDGRLLASVGWEGHQVNVWEVASGRLLRRVPLDGGEHDVRDLCFSLDGRELTACHHKGLVQTWDVGTWRERPRRELKGPNHPYRHGEHFFTRFHVAADRKTVTTLEAVYTPNDPFSRLVSWDLATGRSLHRHLLPEVHEHVAFRPDGRAVAVSLRGGLSLIDVEDGNEWFHAPFPINTPVISPDGALVAARGLSTRDVGVWECATGKRVTTIPTGNVNCLALLRGNRFLVTSDEACLRVWDLADGKERGCWSAPLVDAWGQPFASHLDVSPDGRRAFTALADGSGLSWDLTPALSRRIAGKGPDETALLAWWKDLADGQASRAYAAAWRLAESPADLVVPFLRRHVRPVVLLAERAALKHVEDLDSDVFATREKAYLALEATGRSGLPVLRQALDKGPGLEVKRRLEKLVKRARRLPPSPDELRDLRALTVLEAIGTPAARVVVADLANGAPHAPLTAAATAAHQRLGHLNPRPGGAP